MIRQILSARSALPTLLLLSASAGCAPSSDPVPPAERTGAEDSPITDILNSSVKRQSIGNCWVYASVGWAESLHLSQTGEELNLSESYVSYWHWYEEIAGPLSGQQRIASLRDGELATGGWFGSAAELMRRYGVIEEGAFIAEEAEEIRSARQASALETIEASLESGPLSTTEGRADRELVRDELDRAWQLSEEVQAALDEAFGESVDRNLVSGATPGELVMHPNTIEVGGFIGADGDVTLLSLSDAIGEPSSWNHKSRVGQFAWNEKSYPYYASSRRDRLKDAQRALHDGLPVIATWFVDFAAMGDDGAFRAPPEEPGRQGGHMTVLEDYEIDNVPGYGTLRAGELVTDPDALEAALDDDAVIKFFRIKNSWGTHLAPPEGLAEFAGYHDLYMEYLNGPLTQCRASGDDDCATTTTTTGLWGLVLPPAGFAVGVTVAPDPEPECNDMCSEGESLAPTCGQCVADICEADPYCCSESGSWDNLCVGEVASVCGLTCE